MDRTLYDEDHEAFRGSVKEFLDRQVRPHLEDYQEAHALPREFWLEAGMGHGEHAAHGKCTDREIDPLVELLDACRST